MDNYNEKVIAKAILYDLQDEKIAEQIDRIDSRTGFNSDVLNRLYEISISCRIKGNFHFTEIAGAFIQAGGDSQQLFDFIRDVDDVIVISSVVAEAVNRVKAHDHIKKIEPAIEDYKNGAIKYDDLIATITEMNKEDYNKVATLAEVIEQYENHEILPSVRTGYLETDERLRGLCRGRVTVLASRPGVGKSDYALSVIRACLKRNESVFAASIEMDRIEILKRMEKSESGIGNVMALPGKLYIDDRGNISVAQIAASAMFRKPDLVVVDYLQILQLHQKTSGLYERATILSNQLRTAAKHSKAAWLVLSQLSRNAKTEMQCPTLSDLRDSGAIEQDAYAVMFLYEPNKREEKSSRNVELVIAKNRGGMWGRIMYDFFPSASHWEELQKLKEESSN